MFSKKRFQIIATLVMAMLIGGAAVTMAHDGDVNLIHACISDNNGQIKIIGADETCGNNYTPLDWGIVGPAGAAGTDGVNGLDGAAGAAGAAGTDGVDGLDGSAGAAGTDGVDGLDGAAGIDGVNGLDGAAGAAGTDGVNGLDGAAGTDGADGATGPQGPAGTPADMSRVEALEADVAELTATLNSLPATTIAKTAGDNQTLGRILGSPAKAIFNPLSVNVTNVLGLPVAGVTVTFQCGPKPPAMACQIHPGGAPTVNVTTGADGTATLASMPYNPGSGYQYYGAFGYYADGSMPVNATVSGLGAVTFNLQVVTP